MGAADVSVGFQQIQIPPDGRRRRENMAGEFLERSELRFFEVQLDSSLSFFWSHLAHIDGRMWKILEEIARYWKIFIDPFGFFYQYHLNQWPMPLAKPPGL
jgi:hypothetical protein